MGGWRYRVALGALPDGEQNAVGGAVLSEAASQPVLEVCVRSISTRLPRASRTGRRARYRFVVGDEVDAVSLAHHVLHFGERNAYLRRTR